MLFFTTPTAFRLQTARSMVDFSNYNMLGAMEPLSQALPPHSSHPALGRLILLVFEAVLEVVCVSLPGYIVARQGMFDAEMQKFVANLNVTLFTPCLIFTKLASQLSADKLGELMVIPIIFATQTLVSYLCAISVSKLFGFKKRPRNFVIAMGIFGNSNSLPISLVLSLSKTLKGLHWDKVPGDNDNEVAARGILYLLIFQQLGQLVRWSWGYHVLLAPPDKYEGDHGNASSQLERGQDRYFDTEPSDGECDEILRGVSPDNDGDSIVTSNDSNDINVEERSVGKSSMAGLHSETGGESEEQKISSLEQYTSSVSSEASSSGEAFKSVGDNREILPAPLGGNMLPSSGPRGRITSFPDIQSATASSDERIPSGPWGLAVRCKLTLKHGTRNFVTSTRKAKDSTYKKLPKPLQYSLSKMYGIFKNFMFGLWEFMNPPLWAMLVAIIVASVPSLQRLFFDDGTFIKNSVTSAVAQSGGVAVPLILVVLGANLARNTLPGDPHQMVEDDNEEKNLLIASLISRMLLPTIVMAPILAVFAKFVPVSILDDPIFVIVCFLLTGAPSALQIAQICQINGVYMGTMSKLLFQSYVVWILPSTLILVLVALEVVEWAATA